MTGLRWHLRCVGLLARRELSAYFHTPLGYIVAVLFTALQGFSFWYVVSALADPRQPAPIGAALASHFGGSVLSLAVLVVVVAVIAMRLVAEDRRQGTWESLLTTPVAEGAVVVGKWLGGSAFLALLWLPSLCYPFILAQYVATPAGIDPGPVASALVGVLLLGSTLIAIGVAASAATENQIVAALTTVVLAMIWLLLGDIPDSAPQLRADWPLLTDALEHVRVRAHLDQLARGALSLGALLWYLGVTVVALAAATTLAVWGRRRRSELMARLGATALIAVIVACVNILAARHPITWDISRDQSNSLAPSTRAVLAETGDLLTAEETVQVLVVRAGLDLFVHLQAEVDRLLERMARAQPALAIRALDPALEPGRLAELATEFAIPVDNLRDGGVVVFQRGARTRAVDIWDMAAFEAEELGAGQLAAFRAEAAFASALAEVIDIERPTVCHTTGHGELPLRAADADGERPVGPTWESLGERIEREGGRLQPLPALATGVPGHCRVLLIAGPSRPLATAAVRALDEFLAGGGRLLLALSERTDPRTGMPMSSGLELLLANYNVGVPAATVVDPGHALAGPDTWFTTTGYHEHPITRGFPSRRLTLWLRPRALLWTEPTDERLRGGVLVESSADGFAETTPAALGPAERDARDLEGPVAVAVAVADRQSGARVVVLGGADSLSSKVSRTHSSAGDLLLQRALDWLGGRRRALAVDGPRLAPARLIMTGSQLTRTFVVCVLAMPGAFVLMGLLVFWRRRRA